MDETVVALCQLFLVPTTILFGALGVATTPQLKTLVSALGLITSAMWAVRIMLLPAATPNTYPLDGIPVIDIRFALALATVFMVAYAVSAVAHAIEWNQRRSGRPPV
jgi:hypothetical protein